MIADDGKHFIVCSGYDRYDAHSCTLANAMALLHKNEPEQRLSASVVALSKRSAEEVYLVTTDLLVRALQDVMECEVGEASEALTRLVRGRPRAVAGDEQPAPEPELQVTQSLKDEVTLWCVRRYLNPLALGRVQASALNQDPDPRSLSVLSGVFERAGERKVLFAERDELDQANEYRQLTQGSWKTEAKEARVVQRYLSFINEHLCDRETRYHLAELKALA